MGTEFFLFFMVELGRFLGGNQVLIEQGDLLYKYLEQFFKSMIFLNSCTLLQMDRLQLTAVYCNRRGV